MKYAILPFFLTVMCGLSFTAHADGEDLRGETFCYPAKDVPKILGKLAEVKAERRNIVDVRLTPRFIIKDGGAWPDKFYLAKDGDLVTNLPFSRATGAVPLFIDTVVARPNTDICIDDTARADRPKDDEGLYFEMGLAPLFKSTPGQHSLAELEEAAKDGKKFYKKLLPSIVSVFMPDTDYFAIKMADRTAVPTVFAKAGGSETALNLEVVDDMWIVSLDDIMKLMPESLIVRGGIYDLQPVPSPKTLRKFVLRDAADEN